MRRTIAASLLASFALLATPASAHGDLTIHELETLAIRDFEGQEDSFPWEGFEIWDVYVGDGYNFLQDSDGVYFKVNFAGDGTQRPTGSAAWTINIQFKVGEQSIEREIVHDGAAVTTTFEALEWTIADGNVFQIKAWTPVPDWQGKAVRDIVITSSVDGEPRDVAPGGIFVPAVGAEVPVEGPATPIFPALGEGRVVDQVELTGPAKFIEVAVVPNGGGVFEFTVKNPLSQQGQHVHFREPSPGAWTMSATSVGGAELEGGASKTFTVALNVAATSGTVEPLTLDLYSDIGGRQLYYAYLDQGEIRVVDDAALATAANIEAAKESPGLGFLGLVATVAAAILIVRRNP